MNNNIIKKIEEKYIKGRSFFFRPGDFISVTIWIFEGSKKRLQVFDGLVIAIRKRGLNSTFIVRRNSHGEGIERIFCLYSPIIKSIVVNRFGKVRQAKLYYLRYCTGRRAKIKERI